jgi:hypothetical protein
LSAGKLFDRRQQITWHSNPVFLCRAAALLLALAG